MRRFIVPLIVTSIACSAERTAPTAPADSPSLRLAAGASTPIPRALIVFSDLVNVAPAGLPEDWRPAGITGDGRLRDGTIATGAPSNEYLGKSCGVNASIENGPRQGGDLDYDPDLYYSSAGCGAARFYNFYLGGTSAAPTRLYPHSRVFGIWALTVGQTANKAQGFGVQLPNCNILMFSAQYGGDDLKVTRIDDGSGTRRWTVSSQGGHLAACVVPAKRGGNTPTGLKYYLPFSIAVTEVQ